MTQPPAYPRRWAIGASYLIQQSPGAEQIGGVEVILKAAADRSGTIRIEWTTYDSRDEADWLDQGHVDEAIRGVRAYAAAADIDLDAFDVHLRRFAVHPTDSRAAVYFETAQNALAAAHKIWCRSRP